MHLLISFVRLFFLFAQYVTKNAGESKSCKMPHHFLIRFFPNTRYCTYLNFAIFILYMAWVFEYLFYIKLLFTSLARHWIFIILDDSRLFFFWPCIICFDKTKGATAQQCPTKIKLCPTRRKSHRTFCPTGKTWGKIKCLTRLCFCPTIN